MVISSRTPEGQPNHCAVCRNDVRIEPSSNTADAPCPCCGHLLWFASQSAVPSETRDQTALVHLLRVARRSLQRLGPPDGGTRVVLATMSSDPWLPVLEHFLLDSSSWDEVFYRMWEFPERGLPHSVVQ